MLQEKKVRKEKLLANDSERAVVIAVSTVRMVQVTIDQVVNMVSMWNRFVTAVGAVNVACIMPIALMVWRASRWVCIGNV